MNARTQKLHFANDHPLYFVSQRDRAKKIYEMYFKKVFSIVYLHTESIAHAQQVSNPLHVLDHRRTERPLIHVLPQPYCDYTSHMLRNPDPSPAATMQHRIVA